VNAAAKNSTKLKKSEVWSEGQICGNMFLTTMLNIYCGDNIIAVILK